MGLFKKKKEKDDSSLKESQMTPPKPEGESMTPPPAPPQQAENNTTQPPQQQEGVQKSESAVPDGSFDDIKTQISSNEQNKSSFPQEPAEQPPQQQEANPEMSQEEQDSLFDLSDLDIKAEPPSDDFYDDVDEEDESDEESEEKSAGVDQLNEIGNDLNSLESQESVDQSFIKASQNRHRKAAEESIFITTAQFKSLLEIVENVKSKTKEVSEKHLRLLDLKAEEDIEYENLKKDFGHIEDKLYQVDSLIFEK